VLRQDSQLQRDMCSLLVPHPPFSWADLLPSLLLFFLGCPNKVTGALYSMMVKVERRLPFLPGIHYSSMSCCVCPRNNTGWQQLARRPGWAWAGHCLCFYSTRLWCSRYRSRTADSLESAPKCTPHLRTKKNAGCIISGTKICENISTKGGLLLLFYKWGNDKPRITNDLKENDQWHDPEVCITPFPVKNHIFWTMNI
jgi:hypothetical protein